MTMKWYSRLLKKTPENVPFNGQWPAAVDPEESLNPYFRMATYPLDSSEPTGTNRQKERFRLDPKSKDIVFIHAV